MRVLVTGADGFIGKALCWELSEKGCEVRGAVRSMEKAARSRLPTGMEVVQINQLDKDTDWTYAIHGVDVVVHLAARVHLINKSSAYQLSAYSQINVAGTECLARAAASNAVKRLVYVSSVKVNGDTSEKPLNENDIPAPNDFYSLSKWEAELALHNISKETGLEITILRPPLVYGPGVKANFLNLFKIVASGLPLPMLSINNRRSFIYLGNLVDAIMTCIKHPKAKGQTYLVSDGKDVSTPELIHDIAVALGKRSRLFSLPPSIIRLAGKLSGKSEELERLLGSLAVDSSKIMRELDWKPPSTMKQGLNVTAEWFKRRFI